MTEMTQTHRLQEVARLLLKIYQTLARMGYLDPSWIIPGPHELSHMQPVYQKYNLDPAVVELYRLLPYVDMHGAVGVDFFHGGEFEDFRAEKQCYGYEQLAQTRDPLWIGLPLPAWMTPLSRLGNHDSVIFYDAKKHRIAIEDQSGGSTDRYFSSMYDSPDYDNRLGLGNVGIDSDCEDEGVFPKSDNGYGYGDLRWRDAGDVLRDILGWYENLVETPGGGEHDRGGAWEADLVRPIYRKHGWPKADFDTEAFLVDRARAYAASCAQYDANGPLRKVEELERQLKDLDDGEVKSFKYRMKEARTAEDKWYAKWRLFEARLPRGRIEKDLMEAREIAAIDCPGGVCQRKEDLALWELEKLEKEAKYRQNTYKQGKKHFSKLKPDDEHYLFHQTKLQDDEKKARVYQKALAASRVDVEKLCPGQSLPARASHANRNEQSYLWEDAQEFVKEKTWEIEFAERELKAIREWMEQLPAKGMGRVREEIETTLSQCQEALDSNKERRELALKALEKGEKAIPRHPFWKPIENQQALPPQDPVVAMESEGV